MRILLAFFGAAVVLLALYFEPSHCVRGWLGSEAFFDGRPTSYWRTHVVHDLQTDPMVFIAGPIPTLSWLDRCKSSLGIKTKIDSSFRLVQRNEADAVLKQLADDGDAQVAGFARDVLQGVRAKQPFVDETNDEYREWVRLICTHNRAPQDFPKLMKAIEGE
jgi:hypothetical protein